jgi:hypothetical protein
MAKSITDVIRLSRLAGAGPDPNIDWRTVADLLADQLNDLAVRMSDLPGLTEADRERVARAALAIVQYRTTCAQLDDD